MNCLNCGRVIKVMCRQGTRFCSENCEDRYVKLPAGYLLGLGLRKAARAVDERTAVA